MNIPAFSGLVFIDKCFIYYLVMEIKHFTLSFPAFSLTEKAKTVCGIFGIRVCCLDRFLSIGTLYLIDKCIFQFIKRTVDLIYFLFSKSHHHCQLYWLFEGLNASCCYAVGIIKDGLSVQIKK